MNKWIGYREVTVRPYFFLPGGGGGGPSVELFRLAWELDWDMLKVLGPAG